MEILLIKNTIWPAILTIGVISLLNYIIDRKKLSKIIAILASLLGLGIMVYMIYTNNTYLYLQLYLFMFFLSISLVILALRKNIDAFTIIGIILMIVMLILLLRFTLIE